MKVDPVTFKPFAETAPWETGFAQVFEQRIIPRLKPLEDERKRLWARRKRAMALTVLIALAVFAAGLVLAYAGFGWPIAVFGGLAALAIVLGVPMSIYMNADSAFRDRASQAVLPSMLDFVGNVSHQYQPPRDTFPTDPFAKFGLVGPHNGQSVSDLITGSHAGCTFELAEASLTQVRGGARAKGTTEVGPTRRRIAMVFAGLMFRADRPDEHVPPLVCYPSAGEAPPNPPEGARAVDLVDGPLSGDFVVLAADPDQARTWLTPDRQRALADWYDSLPGLRPKLAVTDRRILGIVPQLGDQFAVGRLDRSLVDIADQLHELLAQTTMVQRLLDALSAGR